MMLVGEQAAMPSSSCLVIGVWCNGNTTDSGPVILGSSPSTPTPFDSLSCLSALGDFFVRTEPKMEMPNAAENVRRYDEDIEKGLRDIPNSDYKVDSYRDWEDGIEENEQVANVYKDGNVVGTIYYSPDWGYIAYPTNESLVMEDIYPTEEEAIHALGRLYDIGNELIAEERPKDGYYSAEEGQAKMDELADKYPPIVRVGVVSSNFTDVELGNAFFGKGATDLMIKSGLGDKLSVIANFVRELLDKSQEKMGAYLHMFKKIIIFADEALGTDYEEFYFHENIHAFLDEKYGGLNNEGKVPRRGIAERFWNNTDDTLGGLTKKFVRKTYESTPEVWPEEFFAYCVSRSMVDGKFDSIDKYLKEERDKEELEEFLNALNYDRTKESTKRSRVGRRYSETNRENDGRVHPSRKAGRKRNHVRLASEGERQQRIAEHIDKLVENLGTKERTTVYHSFDELPEADKEYIRSRERQGRKVRGWYHNGHIFLYLPHIDSKYQAEKTKRLRQALQETHDVSGRCRQAL